MVHDGHEPDPVQHFERMAVEWRHPLRVVADFALAVLEHSAEIADEQHRDRVRRAAEELLQRVIDVQYAENIPLLRLGDAALRLELERMHRQCDNLRVAFDSIPTALSRQMQERSLREQNASEAAKHAQWRAWDEALPEEWKVRAKIERARKLKRDHRDIAEAAETVAKRLL